MLLINKLAALYKATGPIGGGVAHPGGCQDVPVNNHRNLSVAPMIFDGRAGFTYEGGDWAAQYRYGGVQS
jgi:hypothetical protein